MTAKDVSSAASSDDHAGPADHSDQRQGGGGGTAGSSSDADRVVQAGFDESTQEGVSRLRRTWPALLATGVVGGFDLGAGVLALLLVRHTTGSELLGALAFTIGFIALVLAKSELFTENFMVPIAAVVARSGTWQQVARLWSGTAVMNLVGGWVIMWLIVSAAPGLAASDTLQMLGGHFTRIGLTWETFSSAILAGAIMTLMTWMERLNKAIVGKLAAAVAAGFLLAGTPLLHSIVTSLEMFGALQAGAEFGYLDWAGVFGWAVAGNMVGGIGLVTMLRFVQVGREAIEQHRRQPAE